MSGNLKDKNTLELTKKEKDPEAKIRITLVGKKLTYTYSYMKNNKKEKWEAIVER